MNWGTWVGSLALFLAFAVHVATTAHAIRARAFPNVGRGPAWFFAIFGLGLGGYLPALAVASVFAWPGASPEGRYLVDRSSFREQGPVAGDWVWVRRANREGLARVVATAGDAVQAEGRNLRLPGRNFERALDAETWNAEALAFEVPAGFLLVTPATTGPEETEDFGRFELVTGASVVGRPWWRIAPRGLAGIRNASCGLDRNQGCFLLTWEGSTGTGSAASRR